MKEVIEQTNRERPIMGVISYADDFIVSSEEIEVDKVWDETTKALGVIGLEIDQNKSCYKRKGETRWRHKTLKFKKEIVVLGTGTTEKNAAAADEMNPSLAQKRLDDAAELAGYVEAVTRMHLDERKSEALWLMTSKSIARSLDFDAKVVHPEKMRPLAKRLGERTKKICESLLDEDAWTRMKLPTSLGGMGIREVTSQLAVSYEISKRKTAQQSERIANSLVGRRDEITFDSGLGVVVDSLDVKQEESIETMTGLFKWDLMDAAKGLGFSFSISRTLKMHEITTAHKLWTKLDTTGKAAYLANCGSGVGATWTETAPEQGMPDDEWKTAARRRLRLKTGESKLCECGMNKDEMGDHTLSCQKCPWRTRIHDRVRDCLAKQLRRMGATVDLERVAPQWAKKYKGNDGIERIRTARIDVVATIPGSNERQWLDITIRRPTAQTNVTKAAKTAGHAAMMGEREKTKKYGNRMEVGPDTVKPISIELGGRMGTQTIAILQSMTSKLAEASGGEICADSALRKTKLLMERTLLRAEADAINATNANEWEKRTRREKDEGWR